MIPQKHAILWVRLCCTYEGNSTVQKEHIALAEIKKQGIPVVAICGSDCNLKKVDHPIPANDSAKASVEFLLKELSSAYSEGAKAKAAEVKK